ncbi:hypothetical protein GT352_29165 [Streptomyces sp. SID1046]|uniref:hypothetical protein n=1 Tax=Streptomyces sp. SID1046 TaxID=2690249 RepID=UPI00136F3885|nr:hypothetical protein [Streptomyces sp. SID1046]MYV77971.1 hypothetical protein [Streptomyces sp. SID1046]
MTGASGWIWDPDSWQEWAISLLRQKHGADNVIKVPDQDSGDLGIECFTRSGIVYQCYCPENPDLSPRALYNNHRDKITADVKKFIKNEAELERLFGSVKIRSWILFTPRHESHKSVQHCSDKATLVRQANLSYVTDDFMVDVHELADYRESAEILNRGPVLPAPVGVPASVPKMTPDGIDFRQVQSPLISVMDEKLSRIPQLVNPDKRATYRASLLGSHLAGEGLLDRYMESIPEVHQQIMDCVASVERGLLLAYGPGDHPHKVLASVIGEVRARVEQVVPGIATSNAESIALMAVTDWLQQCPLDFEEAG